jgi:regulator of cell morphogenesis and NO signaling
MIIYLRSGIAIVWWPIRKDGRQAVSVFQQAVGNLAAEHPSWTRVFQEVGIDYCCGGRAPLEQACRERNLNPAALLERLRAADAADAAVEVDLLAIPLPALCDHIVGTHHAYLRRELPRLAALLNTVTAVHGARHPELAQIQTMFAPFAADLMLHLLKEEQVLFPLIRRLAAGGTPREFGCDVHNPVAVMEAEHDQAGEVLKRMRALSGDYNPPADACNSYRELLRAMDELERDLHLHVHKENNVLFPRACEVYDRRKPPVA